MKKLTVLIFALAVMFSLSLPAAAAESDFTIKDGVLTYYSGPGGDVVIPDGVTSIGQAAFAGCASLTSVTIPASVTSIGSSAFEGCTSLTDVTIPDSVIYIGPNAFNFTPFLAEQQETQGDFILAAGGNILVKYQGSGGHVTIPDGVTSIGEGAFEGCTSLTGVTIPDSVISIGNSAFDGCTFLTSIVIPNSVTSIEYSAFSGCTALTSVVLPDGLTEIMSGLFAGCTSLTSVTIPSSVTKIGGFRGSIDGAFHGCTSLASVTIPNSVYDIGPGAFCNCTSLTSVVIPAGVAGIEPRVFFNCTSLTSVVIPDSVSTIGTSAFDGCTSLTSIVIPNSVTSIGDGAFEGCTSLANVTILSSNDNISLVDAFRGTPWLASLQAAQEGEFVIVDGTLMAYQGSGGHVTIPDSVTTIGDSVFSDCTSLTSVVIPDSVTEIGTSAFSGCTSLTSVVIPDGVTSIGFYTFRYCTSLVSVDIGASVTSIAPNAFEGCTSLTSITIPASVTRIGNYAFSGCASLANVSIHHNVSYIGYYAFEGCTSLTSVTIPHSVTEISEGTFSGCTSLTNVSIPHSVTEIREGAFFGCTSLASITIPNSVTHVGARHGTLSYSDTGAFESCTSLTNVTIPDSVITIGKYAFKGCTSLTTATIPSSVSPIYDTTFADCTSLTDVYFGGSKDQWKLYSGNYTGKISGPLLTATIHYNSTMPEPPVPTAYSSVQSVNVNGTDVVLEAYALKDANGYLTNYVKLRDVATVLNGTAAQFNVGWDGSVNILKGAAYVSNGSEMSTPFSGDRAYDLSASATKIDGKTENLDAIVLTDDTGGGYTYYQLRDLGRALGFNVSWSAERGIFIETVTSIYDAQTISVEERSVTVDGVDVDMELFLTTLSDGIYVHLQGLAWALSDTKLRFDVDEYGNITTGEPCTEYFFMGSNPSYYDYVDTTILVDGVTVTIPAINIKSTKNSDEVRNTFYRLDAIQELIGFSVMETADGGLAISTGS